MSPPATRGAVAREWSRRAAERVIPRENPGGVAYGVIVIGALLAAESGHHEGYPATIASAIIAATLYWLADAYASALGLRIRTQERLTVRVLSRALIYDWAVISGAAIPVFVLAIAWVAGVTLETAVTAAVWGCVASLIVFELLAGIRSQATRGELALDVGAGALMGLAILALKIVLR